MSEIALRNYVEEVGTLVDHNQVDEAIAHTRHILSQYPKYVEAYRMLGKALIEKGRHLDAADIFQRVLSVEPDDFVSHVGMAIVREDESNLDGAIWHMERAFETQPANTAIQDELKRLYGKRDGLEPARIRLTRGALARMYLKGSLHPQSVAELRAALADEPERYDLRALLAVALWYNQQRVEAAELSADILKELPYCRVANRILAEVWGESGRSAEAEAYRHRLHAVDPYEAYASNGNGDLNTRGIPAQSVTLPRLEYQPGVDEFADDQRPDWMQAIGAEFSDDLASDSVADDAPDWLRASAQAAATGTGQLTLPGAASDTGDLPDWLREMGTITESPVDSSSPADGEAAPGAESGEADIPDWLQSTAESEQSATGAADADSLPEWLQGAPPADESTGDDLPDWLQSGEPAAPQAAETAPPDATSEQAADDQIPDFMREAGWASRDPSIGLDDLPPLPDEPVTGEAAAGVAPDWLKEAMEGGAGDESEAISDDAVVKPTEIPDWLQTQRPPEVDQPTAPTPPESSAEEDAVEPPEWLRTNLEDEAEEAPQPAPADTPQATPADELPSWLATSEPADASDTIVAWLSDKEPAADPSTLPSAAEQAQPEWLRAPAEDEPQPEPTTHAEEADMPDWLRDAMEGKSASGTADTPSDWLSEIETSAEQSQVQSVHIGPQDSDPFAKAEEPPPMPTESTGFDAIVSDADDREVWVSPGAPKASEPEPSVPDWSQPEPPPSEPDAASDLPPIQPEWPEQPAAEAAPPEVKVEPPTPDQAEPAAMDEDAAMAWLESLAARQGAREEELITPPEQRTEELPDWIADMAAAAEPPVETEPEAPPSARIATGELPDWLQAEPEAPPSTPIATGDLPDWLQSEPESAKPAAEAAQAAAEAAQAAAEAAQSAAEAAHAAAEAVPPAAAEAAPPVTEPAAPEPVDAGAMDEDAAMAWLESLAAKQGAREEELITPPEQRTEEMPDWVAEVAKAPVAETPIPTTEPPAPAAAEELPDWMQAEPEAPVAETPVPTPEPPAPAAAEELPDWMQAEPEAPVAEAPVPTPEPPAPAAAEELPDWMQAEPEAPVAETPIPAPEPPAPAAAEELPDWMQAEPEAAPPAAEPELPAVPSVPTLDTGDLETMDETDAMAWLEGLSAAERARAEEATAPEAHVEEMPDWLAAEAPGETAAEAQAPASEELPEWLQAQPEEAMPVEEPAVTEPTATEDSFELRQAPPDWMQAEPEAEETVEAAPVPEPPPQPEPEPIVTAAPEPVEDVPPGEVLSDARDLLLSDEVDSALDLYNLLIKSSDLLAVVIADLEQAALETDDTPPAILQTLGDAYMKDNQLQKALETYRQALGRM